MSIEKDEIGAFSCYNKIKSQEDAV